jgi:hypothetical protein
MPTIWADSYGRACRFDQREALTPNPSTSCSTSWATPRMVRQRWRPGSRAGSTTRSGQPAWPRPKAISTASSQSTSVRSSNARAPGAESWPWSSWTEHADEVSAPDLSRPPNPCLQPWMPPDGGHQRRPTTRRAQVLRALRVRRPSREVVPLPAGPTHRQRHPRSTPPTLMAYGKSNSIAAARASVHLSDNVFRALLADATAAAVNLGEAV